MGNGVSADQGNHTTHGLRDVRESAELEQPNWSELAEASQPKSSSLGRNPYSTTVSVCCQTITTQHKHRVRRIENVICN